MHDRNAVASHIAGDLAMIHEPGYGTTGLFRACYVDDVVVVVDDITVTPAERELMDNGRVDCVRANRIAFQYVIGPLFVSLVEGASGRRVLAFSAEVHLEPLFEVAVFRLAPEPDSAPPA